MGLMGGPLYPPWTTCYDHLPVWAEVHGSGHLLVGLVVEILVGLVVGFMVGEEVDTEIGLVVRGVVVLVVGVRLKMGAE